MRGVTNGGQPLSPQLKSAVALRVAGGWARCAARALAGLWYGGGVESGGGGMAEQAALEFGDNPFTPAPGEMPPYLAGRQAILEAWRSNRRQSGLFKAPEIVMYGPRGTGKTAILGEFRDGAKAAGYNVVWTTPASMAGGEREMADLLLSQFEAASFVASETTSSRASGELSIPGTAKAGSATEHAQTARHRDPVAGLSLEGRMAAIIERQGPLVLLVDEAHAPRGGTEWKAMRALAAAVQGLVNSKKPVCLVLAGTPGLPQGLREHCGTFVHRYRRIGVGLLTEADAREAIGRPLAESIWRLRDPGSRLRLEPAALDFVVQDSDCYPYFLQLWGSALWEQAAALDADTLTLADVEAMKEALDTSRLVHYREREDEIIGDYDLLLAANAAAGSFAQYAATGESRWLDSVEISNAVEQALLAEYPDVKERYAASARCMQKLIQLGFIWAPPQSPQAMEAGIPTFLGYAQELYARKTGRGRPSQAGRPAP